MGMLKFYIKKWCTTGPKVAFPLHSYPQEMCMTYGLKFPPEDSWRIHGISSRFPLQDIQVET